MLQGVAIDGLKALSQHVDVPLRPLTLIFGRNSVGKSSILQALLLLKQTLELTEGGRPLLVASGEQVDLSSFASLVSGHDLGRELSLELYYDGEGPRELGKPLSKGDGLTLSAGLRYEAPPDAGRPPAPNADPRIAQLAGATVSWTHRDGECRLDVDAAFDAEEGVTVFSQRRGVWPPESLVTWLSEVFSPRYSDWVAIREAAVQAAPGVHAGGRSVSEPLLGPEDVVRALDALGPRLFSTTRTATARPGDGCLPVRVGRRGPPTGEPRSETLVRSALETQLRAVADALVAEVACIGHLGPLRQPPARLSVGGHHGKRTVGRTGEHTAAVLARDPALTATVNDWLSRLEIGYEVRPTQIVDPDELVGDVAALRLFDQHREVIADALDVGFGISQILPVITESVARRGATILVEQPEVHVHPALQAQLGAFFASRCTTNRFVVETHSEHLILRLLKLIRTEQLDPKNLSVLYVDQEPASAAVTVAEVRVDEYGEFIDDWPHGFFPERYAELRER